MDAEVKLRWVNALRSGNYEQGKHHLATSNGYCCLGVLCEIAEQDQVVIKTQRAFSSLWSYTSKIDDTDEHTAVPPQAVVVWAELEQAIPSFWIDVNELPQDRIHSEFIVDGQYKVSLADLNDAYDFTFDQIADVIEKYF